MRTRLPLVLTIVLGLATVLLAARTILQFSQARDAATARLPQVADDAERVLVDVVRGAADALRAWDAAGARAAPGEPLTSAQRFEGTTDAGDDAVELEPGVFVRFRAKEIEIELRDAAARRGLRGSFPPHVLRRAVEGDPELGPPAIPRALAHTLRDREPPPGVEPWPRDGRPGNYSRIQIVLGAGAEVAWSAGPPRAKRKKGAPNLADLFADRAERTRALEEIASGAEGTALGYRDAGGEQCVGTWRRLRTCPDLWVVAEVQNDAATVPFHGLSLEPLGVDKDVYAWHVTLALAVLALLLTAFVQIQSRGPEMALLMRVFQFVKPYRWGALFVIALGFVFTALAYVVRVLYVKELVDEVLVSKSDDAIQRLWTIGGKVVLLTLVSAAVGYGKEFLYNWYATAIMSDIRYAIGLKIASLPLSFFHRIRAGDLVARIERDASSMRKVFNQAFGTAAIDPFDLMISFAGAFVLNWRLALVLLGMPVIVYPLFRIAKRIKKQAEKRQVLLADISHVIFQMLVGIKVVKAFGGEQREATRLRDAIGRYMQRARSIHRLSALSDSLLDLLQGVGAAIVMVGGGYFVLGGAVTIGEITGFIVIMQRIYKSSKQLTQTANSMVDAAPGVARVFEILDAENDLVDGPDVLAKKPLAQGIRLDHVTFAYDEKRVLDDVSLDIPAGKVVAVVGPTGAGKSTLCDLVARFYDVSSGAVLYDGRDVRSFTVGSLLDSVAIVTQDAFLFNASIAENIRYGKPDATDAELQQAARDAFVHDEIERMDGAYAKLAGERGTAVSGGQRQRITIARAILKDAPVLILDEATSALDSHAESQVQAALDKLMRGRTVIVVAHRLSTIRNADKVVVMSDGRIVEEGPPGELLTRENGHFRRMYELQMGAGADGARASEGAAPHEPAPE